MMPGDGRIAPAKVHPAGVGPIENSDKPLRRSGFPASFAAGP